MQAPIPAAAVRDTVARLLESREFARGLRETLWSRFTAWLGEFVRDVLLAGARAPFGRAVAIVVVLLIASAIAGRLLMLAAARRRAALLTPPAATAESLRAQARALAQQEAWGEAAHLLHAAIVARLAADGAVRPHPSSTVGDYARALRRGGDERRWRAYRDFGRRYEVLAYGGRGDGAAWAQLDALAAPLLDATDATPRAAARTPAAA